MANVEWASVFFNKVTSRLPDLLTEKGEGKEIEALEQCLAELKADKTKANEARKVELQAEMDRLSGKAPTPAPDPTPPADASAGTGGGESPKPSKRG